MGDHLFKQHTQAVTGLKFKSYSHLQDATEGDYNFHR